MTNPKILSIQDQNAIPTAKKIIQNNGIIAFPTDTIYGLATNAFSPQGIQRIYSVKQRPLNKALPVLIGEFRQLDDLVLFISDPVRRIANTFWPGALTLVLPKGPAIPQELSPYATIGIRMPDLDFTRQLLQETGPLATTSANISGGPNPTTAQAVIDQLGDLVDLILDGGATPGPTASTVVDATQPEMKVLREGPISLSELQALLGES
jgi:L-threonylcarbamoyladenylate synthase